MRFQIRYGQLLKPTIEPHVEVSYDVMRFQRAPRYTRFWRPYPLLRLHIYKVMGTPSKYSNLFDFQKYTIVESSDP